MNMNTKKKEYTKPSVKLVEWNFSEAVCQTASTNSYANCLKVTSKRSSTITDHRYDATGPGTWNRVGSDRTGN